MMGDGEKTMVMTRIHRSRFRNLNVCSRRSSVHATAMPALQQTI